MFSSRKVLTLPPPLPQKKRLEIPGRDGGSERPKNVKECMNLNWNFQGSGVGVS